MTAPIRTTRRAVQLAFLAVTVVGVFVIRGNAERWCPFGGVEALYTYFREGNMLCSLSVSNLYILAAVLLITLLFRRAFCGYMCPVGAISEWLGSAGRRIGITAKEVPHRLDRGLAILKYPLLAVILILTYRTGELMFRGFDPCYALLSRHGADITLWAYVVAGIIAAASLMVTIPFCRWLCPLAAVLHLFSRFSLTRVRRDPQACLDCARCSKACPMGIKVHQVPRVTAARCLSCLNCIAACPGGGRRGLTWGPRIGALGRRWPHGVLVVVLLLCVTAAVAAAYAFPPPSFTKSRGEVPSRTASISLAVHELTCRGRANLLAYFLERDDDYAIRGYLKIEAWPGPDVADVRIIYDPARTDESALKQAITEPYFDAAANIWRSSPFVIDGYDALSSDRQNRARLPSAARNDLKTSYPGPPVLV
ncbi:MAG TPA: 4Fe-4S binding protein [Phycisphaerae bacterium]|nr:4Fe-4S binding protein [Phycisphaerae bacterium]